MTLQNFVSLSVFLRCSVTGLKVGELEDHRLFRAVCLYLTLVFPPWLSLSLLKFHYGVWSFAAHYVEVI